MKENNDIVKKIGNIRQALISSGYFHTSDFESVPDGATTQPSTVSRFEQYLQAARDADRELDKVAGFLHEQVIHPVRAIESRVREPHFFDELRELLEKLLHAVDKFKGERSFIQTYGEILSIYILLLYRCGAPGRESPIVRMILENISRRKAIESDQRRIHEAFARIENVITVALIAKRYAVYVLATRGCKVIFRSEIEFRTVGTSPEALALQITNLLLKNGVKLSEVTEVVCGGGDLGTIPDGIYVLTEKVRDESWKRLHNTSLNRGALVAWELRDLLRQQGDQERIHTSVASPLSFSTLRSHEVNSLFRADSRELRQSLKGYVNGNPPQVHGRAPLRTPGCEAGRAEPAGHVAG